MAIDVEFSATLDVTDSPLVVNLQKCETNVNEQRWRGCIALIATTRVYVGFNKVDVNTDETQEVGKIWLDANQVVIVRVPRNVDMFVLKCASGSSKVFYVED
jgi:uncharacterized protein YggL (DUF469 family)